MSIRYQRAVKVSLATRPNTTGKFFNHYTHAIDVEDLRVRFQIEKTLDRKANKAKIDIYNLADKTRAEFQQKPANVHLQAGYKTSGLATVYRGDVYYGHSRREGAEWVTSLECGTGYNVQRFGRTSLSLKGGSDPVAAVKQLAKDMGIGVPTSIEGAKQFFGQIQSGMVLEGPTMEQIEKLAKVGGGSLDVSIQDDKLVLLRNGDALKVAAIYVSQETGLIGTPEWKTPEKPGQPTEIGFKTLLAPDIVPGGVVKLESRAASGTFRILKVAHKGDTHGNEWETDIEARVWDGVVR